MTDRIYVPATNAEAWRAGLASPKHRKPGRSAHSLAYTWQPADGFPASVAAALASSDELGDAEMLIGIPEYKVPLPGGSRPSQTDLFVLARSRDQQLVTIAVEGKAGESFGELVSDWLADASEGKQERLRALCLLLSLRNDDARPLRYQLLHRTAAGLMEAERFGAQRALMLVHAFERDEESFEDFKSFAAALGATAERGRVSPADAVREPELYLGWVDDPVPAE